MGKVVNDKARPPVTVPDSLLRQIMEKCWAQASADRPTFAQVSAQLATATRTFATSCYKTEYDRVRAQAAPLRQDELFSSVHELITEHALRHHFPAGQATRFFNELQTKAVGAAAEGCSGSSAINELLNQPELIALRLYTSTERFSAAYDKELSFILNDATREDCAAADVTAVAFTLSRYLHTNMGRAGGQRPKRTLPARFFRGGGLPKEHHYFFTAGRKYRAPMFLSTSEELRRAQKFLTWYGQPDYCLWVIDCEEAGRCDHVNFVDKNAGDVAAGNGLAVPPNQAAEAEWLFAPFSTFTVAEATDDGSYSTAFQSSPTVDNPHVVVLRAAASNCDEPNDVPNAPWC